MQEKPSSDSTITASTSSANYKNATWILCSSGPHFTLKRTMSKQHTEINTLEDCYNFHNFPEIIEAINQDPSRMGLPPTFLTHLNASQRQDIISGEYLYTT